MVDMQGIILAWYLPGILSNARQVRLCLFALPIAAESLMHFRMQCWQRVKSCARCWKRRCGAAAIGAMR